MSISFNRISKLIIGGSLAAAALALTLQAASAAQSSGRGGGRGSPGPSSMGSPKGGSDNRVPDSLTTAAPCIRGNCERPVRYVKARPRVITTCSNRTPRRVVLDNGDVVLRLSEHTPQYCAVERNWY